MPKKNEGPAFAGPSCVANPWPRSGEEARTDSIRRAQRLENIQTTASRNFSLQRTERVSGAEKDFFNLLVIPFRMLRPQKGRCSCNVRTSHGSTRKRCISVTRNGAIYIDPRSCQVGGFWTKIREDRSLSETTRRLVSILTFGCYCQAL